MNKSDKFENQYIERARRFRNDPAVHYNCAQAVILSFAEELGLSGEQAAALGAHFGSGMRMGAVCGAITGGTIVMGLMGASDDQYRDFLQVMRKSNDGAVDCAELLRKNAEAGGDRKEFCDGLVEKAVEAISQRLFSIDGSNVLPDAKKPIDPGI